jgi:Flp pilus assembly CpaF family ATPase
MTGNRSNFALELLDAGRAGHRGGIGSIHAGSAIGALRRREQLADLLPWVALVAEGIVPKDGSMYSGPEP